MEAPHQTGRRSLWETEQEVRAEMRQDADASRGLGNALLSTAMARVWQRVSAKNVQPHCFVMLSHALSCFVKLFPFRLTKARSVPLSLSKRPAVDTPITPTVPAH